MPRLGFFAPHVTYFLALDNVTFAVGHNAKMGFARLEQRHDVTKRVVHGDFHDRPLEKVQDLRHLHVVIWVDKNQVLRKEWQSLQMH